MTESSLRDDGDAPVPSGEASETTGERPASAVLSDYREHALTTPLEAVVFWSAVALPFLYGPLLITGISTEGELLTFVGLVALNGAALLAGHGRKRD